MATLPHPIKKPGWVDTGVRRN